MKKIISILSSFIVVIALTFVVFGLVRATDNVDYTPTLEGAQIRTATETVKQGFKFTASVDDTVDFENDENILAHGFFIAKGSYTYANLTNAIINEERQITEVETDNPRTSKIATAYVNGTGKKFSATLVGLENEDEEVQSQNFITYITVIAFVKVVADNEKGYEYIFNSSAEHKIRNVAQIAMNNLQGGTYDPENYIHLIAASACKYFVRADVTNEKVVVSRSIYEADGVTLVNSYDSPNKFVMGDIVDAVLPIVNSNYYSVLSYSNGTDSYTLGSSVKLTYNAEDESKNIYDLTFDGWNGIAIVVPENEVASTDILVDGEGGYYSGKMVYDNISTAVNAEGVKIVYATEGTYSEDINFPSSNIKLLGANYGVIATGERKNGSILTGKITLAAGVDYITIDGFDFSGSAQITHETLDAALVNTINNDNFQLLNSYVDVNITSGNGFIDFNETARNYSKNVLIDGCYFTGTSTTAMIYLDNNYGVIVTNTVAEDLTFTTASNKGYAAFLYIDDTSSGLTGSLEFNNNKIKNITNSSNKNLANVIFVDWIGDYLVNEVTDGVAETIQINNNEFTNIQNMVCNIEDTNEQNLDLDVMEMNYNIFDNCRQCIWLQIGASTINRIFKLNYNKIIKGEYFAYVAKASGDKNTVTIDASNNSYINFSSTENLDSYYNNAENVDDIIALEKIVVKLGLATDEKVEYDGYQYVQGIDAFETIAEALEYANENTIIYVFPGTYNENITIVDSGVALLGAYNSVNATGVRKNSTEFTGTIKLASSVNGIIIDGFDFTGAAQINNTALSGSNSNTINNDGFQLLNSYVNVNITSGNGFINFVESAKNYNKDIVIDGCYFTGTSTTAMIYLDNNYGVVLNDNIVDNVTLTNASDDSDSPVYAGFLYIKDTSTGCAGNFIVNNNTFTNITSEYVNGANALWINWIGHYDSTVANKLQVNNNVFTNISGLCLNIENTNKTLKYDIAEMNCNTFTNCGKALYVLFGLDTSYNEYMDFHYNIINAPVNYIAKGSMNDSNTSIINASYNLYYDENGEVLEITKPYYDADGNYVVEDKNFNTKVINFADIMEITEVVVCQTLIDENFGLEYDGKGYLLGFNAYATLAEALNSVAEGTTIYVMPGTYNEDVTVQTSNITIKGVDGERANADQPDAVITGVVSLANEVDNIIFDNLFFLDDAQIKGSVLNATIDDAYMNHENIQLLNSYVDVVVTTGDGFFDFPGSNNVYSKDIVVENTYFAGTTPRAMIFLENNVNITLKDNYFTTKSGGALYVVNTAHGRGLAGNLDVLNNTFENIASDALWIEYIATLADLTAHIDISYNTFRNINGFAVNSENFGYTAKYEYIRFNYNVFEGLHKAIWFVAYTGTVAEVYYNKFDITSVFYDEEGNALTDEQVLLTRYFIKGGEGLTAVLDHNLYILDGEVYTGTPDEEDETVIQQFREDMLINDNFVNAITNTFESEEAYETALEGVDVTVDQDTIYLNGQAQITIDGSYESVTYETSDETVATVTEDGVIHAVNAGEATITVTVTTAYAEYVETLYITVDGTEEIDALVALLTEGNQTDVYNGIMTFYGNTNNSKNVYGSVNSYYAGTMLTANTSIQVDLNYTIRTSEVDENYSSNPNNIDQYGGLRQGNPEFIVIHDTANINIGAYGNANYTVNSQTGTTSNGITDKSSYHYVIDDEEMYQILDDKYVAYHTNDGTLYTDLVGTGITVADLGGDLRHRPAVTIQSYNGVDYFYLDGKRTNLTVADRYHYVQSTDYACTNWNISSETSNPPTSSSTNINTLGFNAFIVDGEYCLPQIHYKSSYGYYCMRGGANSIGIETSVCFSEDIFKTWHNTAKFTASLLVKYGLTPDRVVFHNNFSGKTCPMTMMNSGNVETFLDMVYLEYNVAKNFSGYTITFNSDSGLIDSTGRITSAIEKTTNIPYTITITDGTSTRTVELTATVTVE